jgi:protein-L-isoaspartate(D-aspartate) O-methyltransferase
MEDMGSFGGNERMDYRVARQNMVINQIQARGIKDPRLLKAMAKVPRHLFVDEALQGQAYNDYPLPIGEKQTISQPYIVALMTEALELTLDDRVLEVGTGSGYQTAILAELCAKVYSIERIQSLVAKARKIFDQLGYLNIVVTIGDGTMGWKEYAPFDAILVTAGAPEVPKPLMEQLADGGRLVVPVGDHYSQDLIKVVRTKDDFQQFNLGGCRFVDLIGEHGWKD